MSTMSALSLPAVLLAGLVCLALVSFGCDDISPTDPVARGRYLVESMGCADCHTPMRPGAEGPQPDAAFALAGHPAAMQVPPPPALPEGPWQVIVSGSMTAWAGPWGVSYAANLTPDPETGLGRWTEQDFVATLRSGRHLGRGRQILPPMPVQAIAKLRDADLAAIFAYLRSVPAIVNRVPDPAPPVGAR